jgi:hypothetical protein
VDATYLVLSLDFGYLLLGGWDGQRPTTTIVDVQRLKILEQLEGVFVYSARNRQGETFLLAVRQEGGRAKAALLDPISLAEGSQWEVEVLEIAAIL